MWKYLLAAAVIAVDAGALFRGAETSGIQILNMFATIGLFIIGLIGSLAVARWQMDRGEAEVERALTDLGPEFVVTDWSASGRRFGVPEYLVVGPGGAAAIKVVALTGGRGRRRDERLQRARQEAAAAARWVADRTESGASETPEAPHVGTGAGDPAMGREPVSTPLPVLVLTRRRTEAVNAADGILVVNPDQVRAELVARLGAGPLDQAERIRITRIARDSARKLTAG